MSYTDFCTVNDCSIAIPDEVILEKLLIIFVLKNKYLPVNAWFIILNYKCYRGSVDVIKQNSRVITIHTVTYNFFLE